LNRDVIIKVVAKGEYGLEELEILQLLNSEPLRSNPANATVPVLDFLEYDSWHFIVMPCWSDCDMPWFRNADECLELMDQTLSALTFLHDNLIAHLDVSHENILMNFHGKMTIPLYWRPPEPIPEFRTTFPVKYCLIDFGVACYFSQMSKASDRVVYPFATIRDQRPPEADLDLPYDPFAADVYQTATLFYNWFNSILPYVPTLLPLLQDMAYQHPPSRISMLTARDRLRMLRTQVPRNSLLREHRIDFGTFVTIPRDPISSWIDGFREALHRYQCRFRVNVMQLELSSAIRMLGVSVISSVIELVSSTDLF